ncbi:MAG TPA: nucleotidyltransferase substrate binding protein [Chlamydiales bacterium]|nr:nucleotidyltransferase substrate binding protein [Chlamydiales bacterium]
MSVIIEGIDVSNLLKARQVFERFRRHLGTDQEQAGAIQSFEFSYEMAWKTMKRILEKRGVEAQSPRDVFRHAARNGLISDPELWFVFLEKRNLTSHTYKEENVQSILKIFDSFSSALTQLLVNLGVPAS